MACKNCDCKDCQEQREAEKPYLRAGTWCAVCKKSLKTNPLIYNINHLSSIMIEDGIGCVVSGGYGSGYDNVWLFFALCDECIDKLHIMRKAGDWIDENKDYPK